jgi:hypothetical protein
MRRLLLSALALVGVLAATVAPGTAQDYRSSVGWNAGVMLTTSLNEGVAGGGNVVDLKPDLTWSAGGHYDKWFGRGQVGGRVALGVARNILPWTQGDRSVYSYRADAGLMLRPTAPDPARTVIPFLSLGAGVMRWRLGNGPVTTFSSAGAKYPGDEGFQLAASGGLGIDFVTPWQWGEGPLIVRFEGRDFVQLSSPFKPIDPDASDFGIIHNVFVSLGLHTGIGHLGGGL